MTWTEWVESMGQYALYYISDGYVYNNDGHPVKNNNDELVTANAVIEEMILYEAMPAPTLITFTIDGTEYQAEEGMTWGEWCESDYNISGFIINNENIYNNSGSKWIEYAGGVLYDSDLIIAEEVYDLAYPIG